MSLIYNGDINGKFRSCQSVFDFEYYKNGVEYFYWFHCGCEYYNVREKYCKNCFSSYNNYKESYPVPLTEDEKEMQRLERGLKYKFGLEDLDNVNNKLNMIVEHLGGIVYIENILSQINYNIDDNTFENNYNTNTFYQLINYSQSTDISDFVISHVGRYSVLEDRIVGPWYRYFIGQKIKRCLELNNICIFKTVYN